MYSKNSFCIIICLLITILCFSNLNSQNIDIDILRNIYHERNESFDPTLVSISNSVLPISITTPIIVYTFGASTNTISNKQKGIYIAESLVVSGLLTYAIKNISKRDRPYETYDDIQNITNAEGYTFPSGHTSAAFATATSLSIVYPKWYVIFPSFTWATAVGYSRMALGVHYPSDVLFGAIVGSGSAYLTYKLNKWVNKKREPKQKILWE
ncbi:MAG TPA: phosphatase PAP2 family protein [Flavobacterium sp.]|jgi:membrane-associated phospholipid phosphatase|nr:phosphatase PAP2 family protein [Flavobacterium sp.]